MEHEDELVRYINLKLAALGQPPSHSTSDPLFLEIARPLLRNHYQKDQLLGRALCPVDNRIQMFLDDYLKDIAPKGAPRLPSSTFVLDRPGLARTMSLPASQDSFTSPYLKSYRIPQGVLHNPKSDRRTTQGLFHIVDGGFPAPDDKAVVPKPTFALLLAEALRAPAESSNLAFYVRSRGKSPAVRVALNAAGGLSGDRTRSGQDDGDPLFCSGQPGEQPGFR